MINKNIITIDPINHFIKTPNFIIQFGNQIDFKDLQDEVIEHWQDQCVSYSHTAVFGDVPMSLREEVIDDFYQAILDDPMACIETLGFRSIAQYVASKQDEQEIVESKAKMIFSGFLNKDFCRKARCR